MLTSKQSTTEYLMMELQSLDLPVAPTEQLFFIVDSLLYLSPIEAKWSSARSFATSFRFSFSSQHDLLSFIHRLSISNDLLLMCRIDVLCIYTFLSVRLLAWLACSCDRFSFTCLLSLQHWLLSTE